LKWSKELTQTTQYWWVILTWNWTKRLRLDNLLTTTLKIWTCCLLSCS
jgi:hypothetical protein